MTEGPQRLRRSPNGRILTGVCSGLAEFTGVDALVFRVVFGVLVLTGGLGFFLYLAAWLLMAMPDGGPSWGERVLRRGFDGATTLTIIGGLLLAGALLSMIGNWHNTDAVGVAVIVALVGFVARARGVDFAQVARTFPERLQGFRLTDIPRQAPEGDLPEGMVDLARLGGMTGAAGATPAAPPSAATTPPPMPATTGTRPIEPDDPWSAPNDGNGGNDDGPTVDLGGLRPDQTVMAPPPAKPPCSILFPVTFALALAAAGIALLFTHSTTPALRVEIVSAAALLAVALGLVVGSRFGRTGGLVALATLLSLVLVGSVVARNPAFHGRVGDTNWRPAVAAQAEQSHKIVMGEGIVDLTDVPLKAGQRLEVPIAVTLGQVRVIVPRTARLELRGRSTLGDITVDGAITSGPRARVNKIYQPEGVASTAPIIELDISCRLGDVEVSRV